jgi:hypothetical protein
VDEETPLYRRPIVLVPAGVIVAVLVVWLLFIRGGPPSLSSAQAQEMAAGFLAQVRSGKADDAWKETSSDFKSMWGQARFRTFVKSKPVLAAQVEFEACEFKTEGNLKVAECRFRPSTGKGPITVTLQPDQGRWRVGRLAVE